MRCRAYCRADVAGLWVVGLAAAWVFGCENRMTTVWAVCLGRTMFGIELGNLLVVRYLCAWVAVLSELRSLAASKSFAFLAALLFWFIWERFVWDSDEAKEKWLVLEAYDGYVLNIKISEQHCRRTVPCNLAGSIGHDCRWIRRETVVFKLSTRFGIDLPGS